MQSKGERKGWSRRDLLRGTAALAAVSTIRPTMAACSLLFRPAFAYVASVDPGGNPNDDRIHVFSLRGDSWTKIQAVPSRAPSSMVLSPSQRILYVANDVATHEGLPRGSVEAFSINQSDGAHHFLGHQGLTLSATRPKSIAISAQGDLLAVAAYGGGAYNLLPVAGDGNVGKPIAVFKETGGGPHVSQDAAHPHTLLFDPGLSHYLLTSDLGDDQVSLFDLRHGKFTRKSMQRSAPGSGPGSIVLHPTGSYLYAWHHLTSVLTRYSYNSSEGYIGAVLQQMDFHAGAGSVPQPDSAHRALAMHASGRMLFGTPGRSGEMHAWSIAENTGNIYRHRTISIETAGPSALVANADGRDLFVVDPVDGSISGVRTETATGEAGLIRKLASVKGASALVFKTL